MAMPQQPHAPAADSQPFFKITAVVGLVRDIGVIVGIPVVVAVGMKLYDVQLKSFEAQSKAFEQQVKAGEAQIKLLEAQNNALKETQYDHALSLLTSQKQIFQYERDAYEKQIADHYCPAIVRLRFVTH
jgi:hypothetical protein